MPAPATDGRPISLDDALSLPDLLDQTRYTLYFGSIPGGNGDSKSLTIKCFNVSIPGMSNEAFDAMVGGHNLNFRGKRATPGPLSASFYEDADSDTLALIRGWHEYVVGSQSGSSGGYIDQYSVKAQLSVYDTTGRMTNAHYLHRLYPQDVADVTLDSTSSSPVQVQVQFKYTIWESNIARWL